MSAADSVEAARVRAERALAAKTRELERTMSLLNEAERYALTLTTERDEARAEVEWLRVLADARKRVADEAARIGDEALVALGAVAALADEWRGNGWHITSEHISRLDAVLAPVSGAVESVCGTAGCEGDARYSAPGRGHRDGCTWPVSGAVAKPGAVEKTIDDRGSVARNLRLLIEGGAGKHCVICDHVRHNDLGYCQIDGCICETGVTVAGTAQIILRNLREAVERDRTSPAGAVAKHEQEVRAEQPDLAANLAESLKRCRICGGVGGRHDGASHDARLADMPTDAEKTARADALTEGNGA
jgi:hypothetical protein